MQTSPRDTPSGNPQAFSTETQSAPPTVGLSISLCEVAQPDATVEQLENMLQRTCWEAGFPRCERIYAGSYFCENYFCGLYDQFHESLRQLCQRYDLAATLVVPIVGQAFLQRVDARIDEILNRFDDVYDEVVVNDVAAFFELQQRTDKRLGLGRLCGEVLRHRRAEGDRAPSVGMSCGTGGHAGHAGHPEPA